MKKYLKLPFIAVLGIICCNLFYACSQREELKPDFREQLGLSDDIDLQVFDNEQDFNKVAKFLTQERLEQIMRRGGDPVNGEAWVLTGRTHVRLGNYCYERYDYDKFIFHDDGTQEYIGSGVTLVSDPNGCN